MKFPEKVVDLCLMLDANKAQDIVVCDSTKMQNTVDFFIIATATSSTHINGIVEKICEKTHLENSKFEEPVREGFGLCNWSVLAFADVFIHLFLKDERVRYNLEKFFNDGKNLFSLKRVLTIVNNEKKKEKAKIKKQIHKENRENEAKQRLIKDEEKRKSSSEKQSQKSIVKTAKPKGKTSKKQSKTAQKQPKNVQKQPKNSPKTPKNSPKTAQKRSKNNQNISKKADDKTKFSKKSVAEKLKKEKTKKTKKIKPDKPVLPEKEEGK